MSSSNSGRPQFPRPLAQPRVGRGFQRASCVRVLSEKEGPPSSVLQSNVDAKNIQPRPPTNGVPNPSNSFHRASTSRAYPFSMKSGDVTTSHPHSLRVPAPTHTPPPQPTSQVPRRPILGAPTRSRPRPTPPTRPAVSVAHHHQPSVTRDTSARASERPTTILSTCTPANEQSRYPTHTLALPVSFTSASIRAGPATPLTTTATRSMPQHAAPNTITPLVQREPSAATHTYSRPHGVRVPTPLARPRPQPLSVPASEPGRSSLLDTLVPSPPLPTSLPQLPQLRPASAARVTPVSTHARPPLRLETPTSMDPWPPTPTRIPATTHAPQLYSQPSSRSVIPLASTSAAPSAASHAANTASATYAATAHESVHPRPVHSHAPTPTRTPGTTVSMHTSVPPSRSWQAPVTAPGTSYTQGSTYLSSLTSVVARPPSARALSLPPVTHTGSARLSMRAEDMAGSDGTPSLTAQMHPPTTARNYATIPATLARAPSVGARARTAEPVSSPYSPELFPTLPPQLLAVFSDLHWRISGTGPYACTQPGNCGFMRADRNYNSNYGSEGSSGSGVSATGGRGGGGGEIAYCRGAEGTYRCGGYSRRFDRDRELYIAVRDAELDLGSGNERRAGVGVDRGVHAGVERRAGLSRIAGSRVSDRDRGPSGQEGSWSRGAGAGGSFTGYARGGCDAGAASDDNSDGAERGSDSDGEDGGYYLQSSRAAARARTQAQARRQGREHAGQRAAGGADGPSGGTRGAGETSWFAWARARANACACVLADIAAQAARLDQALEAVCGAANTATTATTANGVPGNIQRSTDSRTPTHTSPVDVELAQRLGTRLRERLLREARSVRQEAELLQLDAGLAGLDGWGEPGSGHSASAAGAQSDAARGHVNVAPWADGEAQPRASTSPELAMVRDAHGRAALALVVPRAGVRAALAAYADVGREREVDSDAQALVALFAQLDYLFDRQQQTQARADGDDSIEAESVVTEATASPPRLHAVTLALLTHAPDVPVFARGMLHTAAAVLVPIAQMTASGLRSLYRDQRGLGGGTAVRESILNTIVSTLQQLIQSALGAATGNAAVPAPGLSAEERAQLLQGPAKGNQCESDCCICLEQVREDVQVTTLRHCPHLFHTACVDQWWSYSVRCPVCKRHAITGEEQPVN